MRATVGEIVLMKIDTGDFGVWRPLLVTYVYDDGTVDGEVFFQVDQDRRAEWPVKRLFYGLSHERRSTEVRNISEGDGLGQFKFLPLAGVDAVITALGSRLAALEAANASRGKLVAPVKALVPEKRTR